MTVELYESQTGTSTLSTRLAVLLFTDVVGSTELKSRLGTAEYARLLARHNELFESALRQAPGAEIVKHTGDGYFAVFLTASDAVRAALAFQLRMGQERWGPRPIKTRVGIHTGEVAVVDMAGRRDIVGLSADVAARIMSLAVGGQVLLTQQAFNDARQFVDRPPGAAPNAAPLRWIAHGAYLFKGGDDPLEVFEVGIPDRFPLMRPPDSEKVKRVVPHDQEPTLGWRPAVALDIPGRMGWVLEKKLGEGGFGEVWLGRHEKLRQRRVYKFCFDADRLRSFKREFTLFRLLREALGDRPDIAKLHEVKLDEPPYFLESEYTEGGNLAEWAERQGGLERIALQQRLDIVAQIADAVAAAHSVGVLHKDIKPSNVLVHVDPDGSIQPRISDFGIGFLYTLGELQKRGITPGGFTRLTENESGRAGTRMYAPPELLMGRPFTIQGDVYGLGVLLYQMVVGDLSRPLAPGWERGVDDMLLREDVAAMVEGDPQRRLPSAAQVAQRLRSLHERRRARLLRRLTRGSVVGLVLVVLLSVGLALAYFHEHELRMQIAGQKVKVEHQRKEAQEERDSAKVALEFLMGALVHAQGNLSEAEPLFREALQRTRRAMGDNHPDTLASMDNLATLLHAQGKLSEAEPLYREALQRRRRTLGDSHPAALSSISKMASLLLAQGKSSDAEPLLREALEGRRRTLAGDHPDKLSSINSLAALLLSQGRLEAAEPLLRDALEHRRRVLGRDHPDTITSLDNYAYALYSLGRLHEADPLFCEALERSRRILGDEHPNTLALIHVTAQVLRDCDKPEQSASLWREALSRALRDGNAGDQLPQSREYAGHYAECLDALGRHDEATAVRAQFELPAPARSPAVSPGGGPSGAPGE